MLTKHEFKYEHFLLITEFALRWQLEHDDNKLDTKKRRNCKGVLYFKQTTTQSYKTAFVQVYIVATHTFVTTCDIMKLFESSTF